MTYYCCRPRNFDFEDCINCYWYRGCAKNILPITLLTCHLQAFLAKSHWTANHSLVAKAKLFPTHPTSLILRPFSHVYTCNLLTLRKVTRTYIVKVDRNRIDNIWVWVTICRSMMHVLYVLQYAKVTSRAEGT